MAKQLTTSPTRTVAGSYQAPVEGIVDYGAFQKGFESTFKLPKKPKPLADEFDSSVDGLSAQEGVDINFEGPAIRTLNKTIRTGFGLDNLSKQAGVARRDGDVQTFNQINERLARIIDGRNGAETLLKTSANYFNASNQRGATQFARAESGRGLYADGLAESISKGNATFGFGKDENGNEVAGLYVRNYNVDFKGESKEAIFGQAKETISQVESEDFDIKSKIESKARPTMTADDFFIPTEGLTEENLINKYFPPRADLQDNFAEINKEANLDNFRITADDILEVDTSNQYKSTRTGNIITSDSEEKIVSERGYKKIDFAATSAANQVAFSDKYNENKEALYQDAVFGESGERITVKTPIGKYILGFGADGFRGYKAEDFKKVGANGKIGGDIPLNIKNELVKQYSIDKYKVQFGEGAYYYNENGHAVKSAIPVDTKTTSRIDDEDIGDATVTGFMENIFSRFNAATSGASSILKDSPIYEKGEEGGILEGNDARNTLTLLRGREFNGKPITDVKYTKVGELKDKEGNITGPDLRLQVFTQTGDDEIPQMSLVNITDAGSRREFLENIARSKFGSGTTVSKEIAEAYTNIQTTRSDVQSVFGIYSDRLRKTLETGQWNDNIDSKYKAAFDAEMKKRKENSVNNDYN